MKKLQQFTIFKISSTRIRDAKYNVILSYEDAVVNQEIISIADSQLVRTLFEITRSPYSQEKLKFLLSEKRTISKKKNSKDNRKKISEILEQIRQLVFIPEVVSVLFSDKRHANSLMDGFKLNGSLYLPFMASTGMIRRNSMLFIKSDVLPEMESIFNNGRNMNSKIVPAKYGAYYSLYSSSSLNVSFPNIIVVKDKLMKGKFMVDYVEETPRDSMKDPIVVTGERELETNAFDGQGLVSPQMASHWARELELDYTPSAFIVRASFLKGLCVTFDFHRLAFEKGVSEIEDIYGNKVLITEADVIISESQFKLWGSYSSTEDYINNCKSRRLGWGITRVTPKKDKDFAFSSYQFIQSLGEWTDVEELIKPTVGWLSSIGSNREHTLAYLLGDSSEWLSNENWFDTLSPSNKAYLLEESLIKDSYFVHQINASLSKRKEDSFMGRLVFPANYQFIINDPYAQCLHAFGLEFESLLENGECYSDYWNKKNRSNKIALVRSPIVHSSEVNRLDLNKSGRCKEWYSHIYSGIIFPPYGVSLDMAILGGSDADGDIIFTTDYPSFVEGKQEGLPIFYKVETPNKESILESSVSLREQTKGFGTKIGFLTNVGSTMVAMLSDYDKSSPQYKTLKNRYKYIRVAQGLEIDKQKGLIIPEFPKWWTKKNPEIDESLSDIVVTKRPYFFRYLYEHMGKKYRQEQEGFENISMTIYQKTLGEIRAQERRSSGENMLLLAFDADTSFIDNESLMNRVSHAMEESIRKSNSQKLFESKSFNPNVLFSKEHFKARKDDIEKIKILFKEYKSMKNLLRESISFEHGDRNYSTLEQIQSHINKKAYQAVTSNSEDLGNIVVYTCYKVMGETARKFAWECFGEEIYQNIKNRRKDKFVRVPMRNENGSFEYLFSKYGMYLMNINIEN